MSRWACPSGSRRRAWRGFGRRDRGAGKRRGGAWLGTVGKGGRVRGMESQTGSGRGKRGGSKVLRGRGDQRKVIDRELT